MFFLPVSACPNLLSRNERIVEKSRCLHRFFVAWAWEIGGYSSSDPTFWYLPLLLFLLFTGRSRGHNERTSERNAPYVRTSFSSPSVIHKTKYNLYRSYWHSTNRLDTRPDSPSLIPKLNSVKPPEVSGLCKLSLCLHIRYPLFLSFTAFVRSFAPPSFPFAKCVAASDLLRSQHFLCGNFPRHLKAVPR